MIQTYQHDSVKGFRLARTLWNKGRYYTGCFFIDGLMIDTGCAYTIAELTTALEGQSVHTVVNTHYHEDHVGANMVLTQKDSIVLASEQACTIINGTTRRPPLMPYQRVLWGWPAPSTCTSLSKWVYTDHHHFQVIVTPGHSQDHICLYEPDEGWLFCGDAYVGGKDRVIRLDTDVCMLIASLKKIASLPLNRVFTGSGSMVEDPATALAEKIDYLEQLGMMVKEYYHQGFSVNQIRKMVLGRHQMIYYFTQGHFSGNHLVMKYLNKELGKQM